MTDRRAFLETMTGAALAAIMPGSPLRARRSRHRLDRIGLQLYTVRDEMKKDLEGTIAKVAGIGYKEVEFAGYFGKSPADVRAILDRNGLAAPSAHISIDPDKWPQALDAARVIGHRYVVVAWIPEEARTVSELSTLPRSLPVSAAIAPWRRAIDAA